MNKKDFTVDICDNAVRIKGEKKEGKEIDLHSTHVIERQYGMFERSFSLPDYLDLENVKAKFRKGLLSVKIPKIKSEKPKSQKIKISS